MESFGPGSGGSVCDSSDIALSPLVLSDSSSSAGAGCFGTDLTEASVCMPFHDRSAHRSSRESAPGWGPSIAITPFWLGREWFSDQISLLYGSPWGIPIRRNLLLQAEGMIFHPSSGVVEAVGVAPEGAQLIASGLSLRLLRPSSNLELPQWGNCTPWSWDSSLHNADTTSLTQLTARLVQRWSSCRPVSPQS